MPPLRWMTQRKCPILFHIVFRIRPRIQMSPTLAIRRTTSASKSTRSQSRKATFRLVHICFFPTLTDPLPQPDYVPSTEGSHRQTSYGQSASESQKPEYEYVDEDEEKIRKLAAYQLQLQLHQMKMNQKNPFAPPPFPSSGYGTAGLGYSSAGNGGTPSNKAFIPFFGYVDPVVLIAIVAFPVLCTLGVTSLLMPIIPIVIYIIGLIFPSTKKRNRLPASRINSRMRHATDPSAHFSDSISPQAIERMFRVLSQALDKF